MTLAGDLDEALNRAQEGKGAIPRTTHCRAQVIYVTDTHPLVFWSSNRKPRLGNEHVESYKRQSRANTPSLCRLSF